MHSIPTGQIWDISTESVSVRSPLQLKYKKTSLTALVKFLHVILEDVPRKDLFLRCHALLAKMNILRGQMNVLREGREEPKD